MIKRDSILRRLPLELDRKQALFLDGIRHSAEIAHLAYERLRGLLTKIACDENSEHERGELYTAVFLDAWSVVDSIHRFLDLYRLFPEARMVEADPSDQKDREVFQRVRDVRNVTDHLGQRMDYVLSRKSAAMGILSWCTIISPEQGVAVICSIIPGTLGCQSGPIVNPCGKNVELPSGMVSITACEHTADLSEAMTVLRHRVSEIENQIENFVDANNLKGSQAGADLLIQLTISFDNSPKTQDDNS